MAKPLEVDNTTERIPVHLREKRNELIWALSLQDYNNSQIGLIFNMNRSTAFRIIGSKPRDWKPKWVKATS